jgi:cobalt-zinc-cadmium efflux system outer membrane protein
VLSLPTVPTLQALASLVDRSPELRKFANEARVREARVQLARSGESTDVQWQLGARRLEATNEWAAVAGLSIPLGNRSRAQPAIRAARADLAALELEREADEISLYATLAEAYARLTSAALDVSLARTDVLPRLAQAESSAERAYQSGALSFLEWAQVQSENADVRREQLAAAIDAHRALIEIQRLTGEPFLAASPSSAEATP